MIIVDASLAPALARVKDQIPATTTIIVHGEESSGALGPTLDYETLAQRGTPGIRVAGLR